MFAVQPLSEDRSVYSLSWLVVGLLLAIGLYVAIVTVASMARKVLPDRWAWLSPRVREGVGFVAGFVCLWVIAGLGAPAIGPIVLELGNSKVRTPVVDANGPEVHAIDVTGNGTAEFVTIQSETTKLDSAGKPTEISKTPLVLPVPGGEPNAAVTAAAITAVLALVGTILRVGVEHFSGSPSSVDGGRGREGLDDGTEEGAV